MIMEYNEILIPRNRQSKVKKMSQPWQNCKIIDFLFLQNQIICELITRKSIAKFLLFPPKNHVFKP